MTARTETVLALSTWEALREFVHTELCHLDQLDPIQTPLFQTTISRGRGIRAIMFHIEGPRLLRTSAVWSIDESRLLFYDSTGQRIRILRLSESPEPARAAA
jgi:hypothetical protein